MLLLQTLPHFQQRNLLSQGQPKQSSITITQHHLLPCIRQFIFMESWMYNFCSEQFSSFDTDTDPSNNQQSVLQGIKEEYSKFTVTLLSCTFYICCLNGVNSAPRGDWSNSLGRTCKELQTFNTKYWLEETEGDAKQNTSLLYFVYTPSDCEERSWIVRRCLGYRPRYVWPPECLTRKSITILLENSMILELCVRILDLLKLMTQISACE